LIPGSRRDRTGFDKGIQHPGQRLQLDGVERRQRSEVLPPNLASDPAAERAPARRRHEPLLAIVARDSVHAHERLRDQRLGHTARRALVQSEGMGKFGDQHAARLHHDLERVTLGHGDAMAAHTIAVAQLIRLGQAHDAF
jgi:hypothetical protein